MLASSSQLCPGNALEYLGWEVEFLLGRETPKRVWLEKSEGVGPLGSEARSLTY